MWEEKKKPARNIPRSLIEKREKERENIVYK